MSFATKLGHVGYADGTARDCMKTPKTDPAKASLPGILQVRRDADGVARAYAVPDAGRGPPLVAPSDNLLRVVYDRGPVPQPEPPHGAFDALRRRVARDWAATPRCGDALSPQLRARIAQVAQEQAAAAETAAAAQR
jgi:hypothetical protein